MIRLFFEWFGWTLSSYARLHRIVNACTALGRKWPYAVQSHMEQEIAGLLADQRLDMLKMGAAVR
jgi:hypothetical protein